jgi:TPR repeat protein
MQRKQGQSHDPNSDTYREDEDNDRTRIAPYAFGRSARADHSRDSRPLFLSDPNGDPYPEEYINPLQLRRKWSISSRLLMATVVAAALAALYAFFASDASRDIVVNAKASIAAVMPGPSAAAQPDSTQLTPRDIQLKDAGRISPPAVVTTDNAKGVAIAAVNPTREAIATAYQGALQSQAPAPVAAPAAVPMAALPAVAAPTVAAPVVAAPPARQMDPDEFATLMQRAKALLAVGDISSARLLLERAAEAPDASAALMLAQTYDPQRLGASDVRSIVPEPAKARAWYQKAAQLGSADAQRRLAQLPN